MNINFSTAIVSDARTAIEAAFTKYVAINVARLAEEIQARNVEDNVALEDIEVLVLKIAGEMHAPMYLQGVKTRQTNGWSYSNVAEGNPDTEKAKWQN